MEGYRWTSQREWRDTLAQTLIFRARFSSSVGRGRDASTLWLRLMPLLPSSHTWNWTTRTGTPLAADINEVTNFISGMKTGRMEAVVVKEVDGASTVHRSVELGLLQ